MTALKPPVAVMRPHTHETHDDVRKDPYFWLREKDTEPVLEHLKAENAYADAFMAEHKEFEDRLFNEIKNRIPQEDEGVPQVGRDGWWYSWRIKEGDQYHTYYRKRDGVEQTLLDLNALGKKHDFVAMGAYACPKGTNLMWYTLDLTGFNQCQLHLRDLEQQVEIDIPALTENSEFSRVTTFTTVEGRDDALWLVVEDEETKRSDKLYFWCIGDDKPTLVMHEKDERFNLGLDKTADFKHLIVAVSSHVTDEFWVTDASSMEPKLTLLFEREQDVEQSIEHYGDYWFILDNAADEGDDHRNFRLGRASDAAPNGKRKELIPHREHVLLEGFQVFSNHLMVCERAEGLTSVFVYDLVDGEILNRRQVKFPEALIECGPGANFLTDTHLLRVGYESLTTPNVTYDCDMRTMEMTELKRRKVLGGYNHEDYTATRIYATAEDGAKIPITLTHRKDTALDGTAPGYLTGYGAYGLSYEMYFAASKLSLLDRGFVYAIAHIRGGSELGKAWHDGGRMENKTNTFTDFITCAEHLVAEKVTTSERLCVQGASAGGLLMGAVTNMRPDLFAIVYANVPFVDVLTTMLDDTMPLTVGEFEEWGNPNVPEEYDRMKAYSPYDNIESKDYPTILVRTSYNDAAVMYWEPAKWVAALRFYKMDDNPMLFRCNMGAGHGGSSGRFDRYRHLASDFTFICTRLGITS